MYYFRNDYSETAHPNILNALTQTNMEKDKPYGLDSFCAKARDIIKELVNNQNIDVHFLVGGTQTNLTAISSFLRPHEAVISVDSAHIATHETGAIEATGHKIITAINKDGKITPAQISSLLKIHTDEHMVKPRLVKISNATEAGTIYSKKELTDISNFCRENNLLLYLDGARIGSAIAAAKGDLTLDDVTALTDAFYIGGTKNGAIMGEALIIRNDLLKQDFRYLMKHRGAILAKGKVLGIQFIELFKDGLYFDLAKHAVNMADRLRAVIKKSGYSLFFETNTNQVFPIFPNEFIENLKRDFSFEVWEDYDKCNSVVRFVTSWATDEESVIALENAIAQTY